MSYTRIVDNIWQCNDCGAYADGGVACVKHHPTCIPGESEKWIEFYDNANSWVDCEHFEVIDWDEDTQEIYHAMCTLKKSNWKTCENCKDKQPVCY